MRVGVVPNISKKEGSGWTFLKLTGSEPLTGERSGSDPL